MFKRSFRSGHSTDRVSDRVEKNSTVRLKKSYRDPTKLSKLQQSVERSPPVGTHQGSTSTLTSPIVTFTVGKEGRLFAAHEDVLAASPFFEAAARSQYRSESGSKRIDLPDEEPEIFSCVLEYLYVRALLIC
jgi:hypothetical protein